MGKWIISKLDVDILASDVSFVCIVTFFVHHIQSWLVSFAVKIFNDFFEGLDHECICVACHRADNEGIAVI